MAHTYKDRFRRDTIKVKRLDRNHHLDAKSDVIARLEEEDFV